MSISNEMKDLKTNSTATANELREFIGQFDGRSPQEVMGIVANSGLASSIFVSTIGCAVLMLGLTAGPYFYNQAFADQNEEAPTTAKSEQQPKEPKNNATETAPAAATPAETANSTTAESNSATPDLQRAATAMGIDETKTAKPNENPLDNKNLDSLLDGID